MQDKSRCRLSNVNINKLSNIYYGIDKEFINYSSSNRKVGEKMARKQERNNCESNSRNNSSRRKSNSSSNSKRKDTSSSRKRR